jgi:hypothetical protein
VGAWDVGAWERGSVGVWERGSVVAWERGVCRVEYLPKKYFPAFLMQASTIMRQYHKLYSFGQPILIQPLKLPHYALSSELKQVKFISVNRNKIIVLLSSRCISPSNSLRHKIRIIYSH